MVKVTSHGWVEQVLPGDDTLLKGPNKQAIRIAHDPDGSWSVSRGTVDQFEFSALDTERGFTTYKKAQAAAFDLVNALSTQN